MQLDWVHHDAKTDIFEEAPQSNIRKLIEIDAQFHNVLALVLRKYSPTVPLRWFDDVG
jgi:hypothetical protein